MNANLLKVSVVAGALLIAVGNLSAQSSTAAAPQLSYGVDQVVQLAKANVSEDTIISYVQNSGNGFNLDANQIIYLKDQGVSANVINAMINQRNRPVAAAPVESSAAQSAVVTTAPTTTTYVPSSTVYVIPDTQTYYYDNYSYPYYYGWPAVSLSFGGWGGGYYHGGGFHGGGGWHGGGGFHGGGGWHH